MKTDTISKKTQCEPKQSKYFKPFFYENHLVLRVVNPRD